MNKPTLWIESLRDIETAEVMSEITEDYFPGQRLFDALSDLGDEEIALAVDVLVPVHG